jgi:hypothetical protein
MDPWPAERTKRSLSGQFGFPGLCFKNPAHKTYAKVAAPMGIPGCPELAFSTESAESIRIVFIHKSFRLFISLFSTPFYVYDPSILFFRGNDSDICIALLISIGQAQKWLKKPYLDQNLISLLVKSYERPERENRRDHE